MFCMKCGTQLPDDALFCYKCGNKIDVSVSSKKKEKSALDETASASSYEKKTSATSYQDKHSYQIGNKIVRFNKEYTVYIQIMKVLNQEAKKAVNTFSSYYEKWDDASTASEKAYGTFYSLLENGFLSCKNIALENGIYDYSPSQINDWTWKKIREPFVSAYLDMESNLNNINKEQKNEELAREIRKENRFRVVGGGFGIQGAIKGMAMAGAINLGTGVAHSAFNTVGNIFTSIASNSARSDLYNSSLGSLLQGIRNSFELLLPEIAKIITGKVHVDKNKESTIFKHIKDGSFGKDVDLRDPFADAFQAFPFDEELYIDYIHRFPKEEKKIMAMGKDLGIDLEEIFSAVLHYNGFTFHSILSAEFVRASEEPFFNAINEIGKFAKKYKGDKYYKLLSRVLNSKEGLTEINSLEVVHGLKTRYAVPVDLPAGLEEVQDYRKKREAFFSDMESKIKKTCQETPLKLNINIGSSSVFIAFILRLCKIVNDEYLSDGFGHNWNGHIYIGADITPVIEDEIRDTIWYKDASDIYLYYHNGKKGKFEIENYIALTSDGIVQQDKSARYHNLKIKFDKGTLGDDLVINNENWSISLFGDNLLWLVNVIENLQPFCEAVEHVIECKKEGVIKHDSGWLHDIGVLFIKGDPRIGLKKDYAKAKYWFQRAASLGEKDSKRIISEYLEETESADKKKSMTDFAFPASYQEILNKRKDIFNKRIQNANDKDFYPKFVKMKNSFDESYWREAAKEVQILEYVKKQDAMNAIKAYASKTNLESSQVRFLYRNPYNEKVGFLLTDDYLISSLKPDKLIPLNKIKYLRINRDGSYIELYTEPSNVRIVFTNKKEHIKVFDKLNEAVFGFNTLLSVFSNHLTPAEVDQGVTIIRNSLSQENLEAMESLGERLYILDTIPQKKAKNVINSYAKSLGIQDSDILILYDNTVFGNAKDGMIITNEFLIDSENKRPVPLNQIQYLRVIVMEKGEIQVYAEPQHLSIMKAVRTEPYKSVIDKINQYIFGYPEKQKSTELESGNETSSTSQYVCPICGQSISYKDASCDNCGTKLSWGDETEKQSETSTAPQDTASAQQYVCPTCGQLINYKDAFCDNCGTQLVWE